MAWYKNRCCFGCVRSQNESITVTSRLFIPWKEKKKNVFQEKDMRRHVPRKRHTTTRFEKKTYYNTFRKKDRSPPIMKKKIPGFCLQVNFGLWPLTYTSAMKKNISSDMSTTEIWPLTVQEYVWHEKKNISRVRPTTKNWPLTVHEYVLN